LRSIEDTILENWPGPITTEPARKPIYHFALMQHGVDLDFHLEQLFRREEIVLHFFEHFEELAIICHRFQIDSIIIGGRDVFNREVEMVRSIKTNIFLSIIPVVLYHPSPDTSCIIAVYENGAEDFIYGDWHNRLVEVRIKRVIERNRRDLAINPSTFLPGPGAIDREIRRQIQLGTEFALCLADLDNFKAFNDHYGYVRGDKVIKLTAQMIKDIVFDLCREGFVGHIAGDDFVFIIPCDLVEQVCTSVIKTFDAVIPYKYDEVDRERGFITTKNRRDQIENFPLLTISIPVLINSDRKFSHIGEMSQMLADLKKATKGKDGSNYMVERRKIY